MMMIIIFVKSQSFSLLFVIDCTFQNTFSVSGETTNHYFVYFLLNYYYYSAYIILMFIHSVLYTFVSDINRM